MKDFKCTFETGKYSTEVEFVFEGETAAQAKFYIFQKYPKAKNVVVKEL